MTLDPAALELIMLLEREHAAYRDREAIAWTVACVDDETGERQLAHSSGLFPDERSATEHAARLDAEDRKWETEGWRHEVVSIFPSGVDGML